MTILDEFFLKESIKKADVLIKTGISTSRMTELSRNESTILRVDESYLIALAIDLSPSEILNKVCEHIKLKIVK